MERPVPEGAALGLNDTQYRVEGYRWKLFVDQPSYSSRCDLWQHLCRYHLEGVSQLLEGTNQSLVKAALYFSFIEKKIFQLWKMDCRKLFQSTQHPDVVPAFLKPELWSMFRMYALCLLQKKLISTVQDPHSVQRLAMAGYQWSTQAIIGMKTMYPYGIDFAQWESLRGYFFSCIAYGWSMSIQDATPSDPTVETGEGTGGEDGGGMSVHFPIQVKIANQIPPPLDMFKLHRDMIITQNKVHHIMESSQTFADIAPLFDCEPFIHKDIFQQTLSDTCCGPFSMKP